MSKIRTRYVATCGLFCALALIFSYIELMIPISIGIPGVKLGFANICILSVMFVLGPVQALIINLARVLISSLLFGNITAFLYSLSGAVLSWLLMAILYKLNKNSIIGISVVGGVAHNIAQLLVAMLITNTAGLLIYFPALLISGSICGYVVSLVSAMIIPRLGVVANK